MTRQSGMTLVELLAALTITAMVAAVLAQSLSQLAGQTGRLERSGSGADIDQAAGVAFKRIVERVVILQAPQQTLEDRQAEADPVLRLEANQFTFIASEPGYPSRAGLYAYRLAVQGADDGYQLVVTRAPLGDADLTGRGLEARLREAGVSTPIWSGNEAPRLSVFDRERAEWVQSWDLEFAPYLAALSLPDSASVVARLTQTGLGNPETRGAEDDAVQPGEVDPNSLEMAIQSPEGI